MINQAVIGSKNNGKKYYEEYINNPIELQVSIMAINPEQIEGFFTSGRYTKGLMYRKLSSGYYDGYKFRDNITKKWFNYLDFDSKPVNYRARYLALDEGREVILKVNTDDLENEDLGTFENPVPVFYFESEWLEKMEKSDREKTKKWETERAASGKEFYHQEIDYVITQEAYEHNVIGYLTYIMPKKEFNERFKK